MSTPERTAGLPAATASGPSARRRSLLQAALAATAATAWPAGTLAQGKPKGRALLVGNTSYTPSEENLPPAEKCLRDFKPRLIRMGFEVVTLSDPGVDRVRQELDVLQRAVAADPAMPIVFYFIGHGFQSNSENFMVPAGSNLNAVPAQLSKTCISLEREIFSRLKRTGGGPAATVILVDACRTPDRPHVPGEGYNQTLPPEGCHVAFATGPGKRAFAPNDPEHNTVFADVLIAELDLSPSGRSILLTLESVRAKVAKRVNSNPFIVKVFGPDAQVPEVASNVRGDPTWAALLFADEPVIVAAPAASASASASAAAPKRSSTEELAAARAATSPEDAAARLRSFLERNPEGDDADLALLRLRDTETVLKAGRAARLELDPARLAAKVPAAAEDIGRALKGDKYAALRVAERLQPPAAGGELLERTDYGRWMIYAAYLGNGIAAYRLSLFFRNVDRRDAEASRYLGLARAAQYTPPPQLDAQR